MNRRFRLLKQTVFLLLLVALIGISSVSPSTVSAQRNCATAPDSAQALLDCMSIAERIGQLFLVTFEGSSASAESDITDLILNYHIGGVALQTNNDNIITREDGTPQQLLELVGELQSYALLDSNVIDPLLQNELSPIERSAAYRAPIPLFIAINQEGDNAPYSAIHTGLTQLPSAMAIGATWQPQNADAVGQIVGRELSAIGINMLLGPSLDVLSDPSANNEIDLNNRSFGGNPYWVGQMGRAYINGIQTGSSGKIAVIAKYFPGYGSSNRNPSIEIGTVRKTLVELQQEDLVPFVKAISTQDVVSNTLLSPVAGLLTTHTRYQDLGGASVNRTDPFSLSATAQTTVLNTEAFAAWRAAGGLIVSDALGIQGVQTLYVDVDTDTFRHRQVAKDAFVAGNDLLYLGEFAYGADQSSYEDQLSNIRDTITWFQDRYTSEPDFQQSVDAAVLRLLQRKLSLYSGDFSAETILPNRLDLVDLATIGQEAVANLPQDAITLLSPNADELLAPPVTGENIIIFTDLRTDRQCSACDPQPQISVTALEDRILALYGPEASNQVDESQVQSFSYDELGAFLAADDAGISLAIPFPTATPTPNPEQTATPEPDGFVPTQEPAPVPPDGYFVQEALNSADWIIFAMLDVTEQRPSSKALQNFLEQRSDLALEKNVVVFAYGAPTYLDPTDVSKLTAYYGVYSKTDSFIDASIRLFFQDLSANGLAPIDIAGIGYTLSDATQPNPAQRIPLFIVQNDTLISSLSDEPIRLEGGESVTLQTGVIVDINNNPVPDGTEVIFIQEDFTESLLAGNRSSETREGVATFNFLLPESLTGQIRIRVNAGEALISDALTISGNEASIAEPTPLPTPTETPLPTASPTAPPTATPIPTPLPPTDTPTQLANDKLPPSINISLPQGLKLLGVFAGLFVVGGGSALIGHQLLSSFSLRLRLVLWTVLGGLFLYNYVALGLPGSARIPAADGPQAAVATIMGGVLGVILFCIGRIIHRVNNP